MLIDGIKHLCYNPPRFLLRPIGEKMKIKLYDWKPGDDLQTPEAQAEFIVAALEENDPAFLAQSLAVVARAKGKAKIGAVMDGIASVLSATGTAPRTARRKTSKRAAAMA